MPYAKVYPIIDTTVRTLCPKRYPGHPKGCPNYGKRPTCPPQAPLLADVLDLSEPVWAVWNVFDFGGHVERYRAKHPDWSKRQLANCRYWQGTARKQLRQALIHILPHLPRPRRVVKCPEACGVNVTATMKSLSVYLQWPPRTITYQVALVGTPIEG